MSLYFGDFEISQLYLGDLDPSAAYIGDVQIYPSSVVITGISITSAITSTVSGGVFNIRVKSESNWTLSVSDNTWITVSPASGTSGSNVVSVTISDNDTGADRNGYITATTTDNAYSAVCSISQEYMVPYIERYFTVVSLADDNTCTFYKPSFISTSDATSISYSKDNGATWTTMNVSDGNVQTLMASGLNNGDKVLWKGIATRWGKGSQIVSNPILFCSKSFKLEGNIISLLCGDTFTNVTELSGDEWFAYLFNTATALTDAENLVIPVKTVKSYCYAGMFEGCTNLINGPQILCDSIGTANFQYVFQNMFYGCTKLNYIVCTATVKQNNSTSGWVAGVASTGTFVKSANMSTSTWGIGASGIPNNWTVVDYTG